MIHPSYNELIDAINSKEDNTAEPVVNSRYSVVIASARRARQLIEKDVKQREKDKEKGIVTVAKKDTRKPLSIAVEELYNGSIHILSDEEYEEKAAQAQLQAEAELAAAEAALAGELYAEEEPAAEAQTDETAAEDESV